MSTPAPMPMFLANPTVQTVRDGNWSDSGTFSRWPLVDGDVVVNPGYDTFYDLPQSPNLNRVALAPGAGLHFDMSLPVVLNCGTLYADMDAEITAGSCVFDKPITGSVRVNLGGLPFDQDDPGQFGGGLLIAGGTLDLCGSANKVAYARTGALLAGATSITLDAVPVDWQVNDVIEIPGTALPVWNPALGRIVLGPTQDDFREIRGIVDHTVFLDRPLLFNHFLPDGADFLHIANMNRRITFASAQPNGVRAHAMFMTMNGMPSTVNACHAAFVDMGRTRADIRVTDPQVDGNGVLVPGTSINPRGRYAVHRHIEGVAAPQHLWDSLVVYNPAPNVSKWGFDNHGSNVRCINGIAYGPAGACFATERGDEVGEYTDCLALRSCGAGDTGNGIVGVEGGSPIDDFGFNGFGLWLQGPGVIVNDLTAYSCPASAFAAYLSGVSNTGRLAKYFPAGSTTPLTLAPFVGINGINAYCSVLGAQIWWAMRSASNPPVRDVIQGLNTFGCPQRFRNRFSQEIDLIDSVGVWSGTGVPSSLGDDLQGGTYSANTRFVNPQTRGFHKGMQVPGKIVQVGDANVIADGTWEENDIDLEFQNRNPNDNSSISGALAGSVLVFTGVQTFDRVRPQNMWFNPSLVINVNQKPYCIGAANNPAPYFAITQATFTEPLSSINAGGTFFPVYGQMIYYAEQHPNFVFWPAGPGYVYPPGWPMALVGLTNDQAWKQFGLAIGGIPAYGASGAPFTNGLVGPAQMIPASLPLEGPGDPVHPKSLLNYHLSYKDFLGRTILEPGVSPLVPGWNMLTRSVPDASGKSWLRTWFIFGPTI